MFKLIIEDDEGKTTIVPLIRDEITIGRKEGNTIRLTERNVSRRHAKLLKINGAVFIEDLESYNGIKVNGTRIAGRTAFGEGDRIEIGDYALGLQVEGEVEVGPVASQRLGAITAPTTQGSMREPAPAPALVVAEGEGEPTVAARAAPGSVVRDFARLVCVSSNFAGLEAVISKPLVIVGRTPDNDIVINHRSVSRHHAQVIEENGRFTIMDMQSANGVRVNGEEYGKVELRRGDLIDLGHVRLRFVAPGEPFQFSRDATIYDLGRPAAVKRMAALAAGVVLLAGVGLLAWRWATSPSEPTGAQRNAPPPSVGIGASENPTAQLRSIRAAIEAQAWDQVLQHCTELRGATRNTARPDCVKAAAERAAKQIFDRAVALATTNDHAGALALFQRVPADSVYRTQLLRSTVYAQARVNFEAQALQEIDEAVQRRQCDEVQAQVGRLRELLGSTDAAEGRVEACREAAQATPTPKPTPRSPPRTPQPTPAGRMTQGGPRGGGKPSATPTPPPTAGPAAAVDPAVVRGLVDRAWTAYREGFYSKAATLAGQVLRLAPKDPQAWSIVGASACYLKQDKQAQSAYEMLDSQRRQLLRRVCERMGVNLQ